MDSYDTSNLVHVSLGEGWFCKDANDIPYETREFVDQMFFSRLESDRCTTTVAGKRMIVVR